MLILTRKEGETVSIGDTIVHILSTRRGRVKLGIETDTDVPVHSGERDANARADEAPKARAGASREADASMTTGSTRRRAKGARIGPRSRRAL